VEQKGTLIKSLLAAVEKLYGRAGLAQVKEALPPAILLQIEPMVLSVKWYPVEVVAEIQLAVRNTIGRGSWEVSRKLGREAARADFSGIYRTLFLRAVQYDHIWDRLERAWSAYNSKGTIAWGDRSPGHALGQVSGVSGFNPGIWNGVAGRAEGILLLSGAKSVDATVKEANSTGALLEMLWFD
jgi:hypothetical protein